MVSDEVFLLFEMSDGENQVHCIDPSELCSVCLSFLRIGEKRSCIENDDLLFSLLWLPFNVRQVTSRETERESERKPLYK